MKLGVLSVCLYDMPFPEALSYLKNLGVQTVEIGAGGFPGTKHADPAVLLSDGAELDKFKGHIKNSGLEISALSCHGNPVHPQKQIAEQFHRDFEQAVLLAEKLGVDTVITFSGCPGDAPGGTYPNWVTCPWPPDFLTILEYQWNDALIPYWKKAAGFANSHGVTKIALELHPGMCVYNTTSLLRLREAVGDTIGANLDPSHLFWQGMDVTAVIRELRGAIHHFHAKDTKIDAQNTARAGVLDTGHFSNELGRSWLFRTVGYGHDSQVWKDIISNLRMTGYDGAISIEHEDSLMTGREGLEKAVKFLQDVLIYEGKAEMWWA